MAQAAPSIIHRPRMSRGEAPSVPSASPAKRASTGSCPQPEAPRSISIARAKVRRGKGVFFLRGFMKSHLQNSVQLFLY